MRRVAVLDHGMGNLRSVAKALEAAGARVSVVPAGEPLGGFDVLCVPGQGVFGRCMAALAGTGAQDEVRSWIGAGRPYLGICLGMQVLFERSEEGGDVPGLGLLPGSVQRLPAGVRVPHIGWNTVDGLGRGDHYYFDHSYAVTATDPGVVAGWCEHGVRFAAAVARPGLLGVQFHPEKSSSAGIELLRSYLEEAG